MKRKILISLFFVLMFVPMLSAEQRIALPLHGEAFDIRVVSERVERTRGLMFVEKMPEKEGMLFVFDEEKSHAFWMKNTFLALDLIWIDRNGVITHIHENAIPGDETRIVPHAAGKYVLELNAGMVEKIGLVVGEQIDLKEVRGL